MTSPLFLAESGGILEMAQQTGEAFGFNGWLFLSQAFSFSLVCVLLYKFAYQPILTVLEKRRSTIEQSLDEARKIKEQLAESERRHREILTEANVEAQRLIDEARASAQAVADRRTQQAIAEAEQIVTKAREAAELDRQRLMAELKREVARLVVETTGRVTGKILTPDDQRRLSEETSREIAA